VFPGIWDISVAGHIGAGEEILEGAKREVFEEIGIEIQEKDLIKIGTRVHQVTHENGIQDNEHHHVFIAQLKAPISKLIMQEEEVAGLELWDLKVLKETKNLENVLLPRFHEYYVTVYNEIVKHLQ
jgi:isopentenyl-diphosphate delta-isomerase